MDEVAARRQPVAWNGRELRPQNPRHFKKLPLPEKSLFAIPSRADLRGEYALGHVVGGSAFSLRREEDFDNPLILVAGEPRMGKTLAMRCIMTQQMEDAIGRRLMAIETQKTEHIDLAGRSDTLYFDESIAHNPYLYRSPRTAQSQATAVSTMKADTFGLIPGSGAHLVQISVADELYERYGGPFTEAQFLTELIRKYDKHEWRADQGRLIARAIERSEQISRQLPTNNTTESELFQALETAKHIVVNLTHVQGVMQTYKLHTILDAVFQFQRWTMELNA